MKITPYKILLLVTFLFASCQKEEITEKKEETKDLFVRGADMSFLPLIEREGAIFFDQNSKQAPMLDILKANGVNTIRIRLWHSPDESISSLPEVQHFVQRVREKAFNVWICPHYSDTWADPGHQSSPRKWQHLSYDALKDSVQQYTARICQLLKPDIIQLGNEINAGFLHPYAKLPEQENHFKELLTIASQTVRKHSPTCRIMIHLAGINDAMWILEKLKTLDYDVIGVSYYPLWHGKDLKELETSLNHLSITFEKDILIAETAYPFTLDWNDWTHNVIGRQDQLIFPDYPATPEGQKNFLQKIRDIVSTLPRGKGFAYWGGEWVAFRGRHATNGSNWENQALFDFNNKALPALEIFKP
ncbi:MAG: arabinogalactan endo-1,4-beta-galactosidase [Flammeovirgaceae bacterium]|nr:arabinogalactan endo-1,4-beta-galactosidase [Flammeovirgaceae bacterium]